MSSSLSYAYYPGCSGQGTSIEYEQSSQAVCKALGITLQEIPDWSCCGSTPAHTVDHTLSAALSARNLGQAEGMIVNGVITPCPSCLTNLKTASHRMKDETFRAKTNALLEKPVNNTLPIMSVLQVIYEQVGPEKLKEKVVRPLTGMKLAPYYGCIMNRPPDVMDFDDCENPIAMDRLMEALGIEITPFPLKVECCGASYGVARKDIVMHLSGKLLDAAEDCGAEAMVTACPLCQMNLDLRQGQINSANKTNHAMPIFYYTQLIGMALGLDEADLGMKKLCVDPGKAFRKMEARKAEALEESVVRRSGN